MESILNEAMPTIDMATAASSTENDDMLRFITSFAFPVDRIVQCRQHEEADYCSHRHSRYDYQRHRILQVISHIAAAEEWEHGEDCGERCHYYGLHSP